MQPTTTTFGDLWIIFWPVLAVVAFAAYVYVSKKQGKTITLPYSLLFIVSLLAWIVVFLMFR